MTTYKKVSWLCTECEDNEPSEYMHHDDAFRQAEAHDRERHRGEKKTIHRYENGGVG
ncbi:hypothetical protein [Euzebya tangerina]|uniref:hypothetical protein n=1 Tax=Euzebya tangerina TaxID=591198 RepID=UPI0013C2E8EA|nr:hypothetical protein [Euzebya tangerina]